MTRPLLRAVRLFAPKPALVLVLLAVAAARGALASTNGFRVEAGPDQNFAVTGAIDQTSSSALSANGVLNGLQGAIGSAAFTGAAGPGLTRVSMNASYGTVNNFPFSPHVQAVATTDLLISGPPGQVAIPTSINLHVDGTIDVTSCGANSICDITLFLFGPSQRYAEVSATLGLNPGNANFSGLAIETIPGGRRVHGDVAVPLTVMSNTPFTVTLALQLGGRGQGTGAYEGNFDVPGSQLQYSFAPTGVLFNNLPAGYTASGEGVVDNHWSDPFAPPSSVVVSDCNDPLLASLTTVTGSLIIKNVPLCTQVLLPNLVSVGGDLIIKGNPAATVINLGSLTTVSGSVDISGNGAAGVIDVGHLGQAGSVAITDNATAVIDIGSLTSVAGSVDITESSASSVFNIGAGNLTCGSVDIGSNSAQVAGDTAIANTDVTMTSGSATMHVRVPTGAFSQPVTFKINHLSADPPAPGTAADGTPATIAPITSFQFVFAVPTLNVDASLTFTIDLSTLAAGEVANLLNVVASGAASIVGKSDAPGAAYTAFPLCASGQTPALNGCAAVSLLDAAGQPTAGPPAFVRFDGVVGHFSSYGIATIVKKDVTPPVVARDGAADACSLPGDAGWCRGTKTAGFSASDAGSSIASPCAAAAGASCAFTRGTATNGAAVAIASGPVCDAAGNCNPGVDAGPFAIDSVPPALAPTIGPLPLLVGTVAAASPNATDATSGVASSSCEAVDTSSAGARSLTCTARDVAGNTSTVSVPYTVAAEGYRLVARGWPAPGTRMRPGREMEFRIAIEDGAGRRLADGVAAGLCVRFRATSRPPVNRCLEYEREDHVFEGEWRAQGPGRVDLQVTVDDPRLGSLSLSTYVLVVP